MQMTPSSDNDVEENARVVSTLLCDTRTAFIFMNADMFQKVYPLYMKPKIGYRIALLSTLKKYIDKLERVQKKCGTRMVLELACLGCNRGVENTAIPFLKNWM